MVSCLSTHSTSREESLAMPPYIESIVYKKTSPGSPNSVVDGRNQGNMQQQQQLHRIRERMFLNGSTQCASLFTRQGNKESRCNDCLGEEAKRIQGCKGRAFARPDEPEVLRVWLPNTDCPGLAMSRALGDFCLKNFGLISLPKMFYRRLTRKDEFVVLATDGVWDVLSNDEVVDIVASVPLQSQAARALVESAVHAWKDKYPTSKVDDCAAVCLFFNSVIFCLCYLTTRGEDAKACSQWPLKRILLVPSKVNYLVLLQVLMIHFN